MAGRINNVAAPGSLFKQPGKTTKKAKPSGPGQRKPREKENGHLEAIRQCPCLSCRIDPAGEAAHLRLSNAAYGKDNAGIGAKPGDKWTLPLCHACHMDQHSEGEIHFWHRVGLDPFKIADSLYRVSPNVEAMRAMCFVTAGIAAASKEKG